MRLPFFPLLPLLVAACAPPPPAAPPRLEATPPDTLRHIATIEHGIFPGARIEGEKGSLLKERMRVHHVPGLSLAVFHDFQIVWAKGYGFADVEKRTPVTGTTLFQAGSISKPVAAMAALKKVEEGKLALDANINLALKSWKLPENDLTRATPVTLRELLSHTAGVTVHGFPGYAAGEAVPTLVQVLDGTPPANTEPIRVDLAPKTKFRYSGGGITIMQEALIDVEGKPFPQILAETVLGPVGMTHSTYEQPLPPDRVGGAAAGYSVGGEPVAGKRHVYPEMAAAGLWTTPSDLARFAIELALEAGGKSARVLSAATAREMLTKIAPTENPENGVGLGVFLEPHGGVIYFGHDGADEGFQAMLLANPAKGEGVAMMANSDEGLPLMQEILPAVASEYAWAGFPGAVRVAALPPARLAEIAGNYQVHDDRIIHLTVEADHLLLRSPFLPPATLVPISESTFVSRQDPTRFTFSPSADGQLQIQIVPPPGDWPFGKRLEGGVTVPLEDAAEGRIDQAAERYRVARAKDPKNFSFSAQRLDAIAVGALLRGDAKSALLLFRVNVAAAPDSMNAYDSLADGYMRAGDKAEAIATYRKSLAAFARDKELPLPEKEVLRKTAVAKLKELGATP